MFRWHVQAGLISTDFFLGAVIVIVLSAETAFLMWLGEKINENGIGNGISLLYLRDSCKAANAIREDTYKIQGRRNRVPYHSAFRYFCNIVIVG